MSSSSRHPTPRRDSWPPTQMRLRPSIEQDDTLIDDLDLSFIDDDPLNYFLTPAPSSQDDDLEMEMDFDAGIDSSNPAKHPVLPIVRSISPSSLESSPLKLNLLSPRPPTPPRSLSSRSHSPEAPPELDMAPTPEEREEEESYLVFGSSPRTPPYDMPFTLRDFADARSKTLNNKGKGKTTASTLLSPTPVRSTSTSALGRGRLSHRPGPRPLGVASGGMLDARGRTRSWSGRLSPRAWREPSPDVWSIEEETEEDLVGQSEVLMGDSGMMMTSEGTRAVDIPVKQKKRVRFVLPVQEVV